eukprot:TCONS_00064897-protein
MAEDDMKDFVSSFGEKIPSQNETVENECVEEMILTKEDKPKTKQTGKVLEVEIVGNIPDKYKMTTTKKPEESHQLEDEGHDDMHEFMKGIEKDSSTQYVQNEVEHH